MPDLDHYIFDWRPQITTRREAQMCDMMVGTINDAVSKLKSSERAEGAAAMVAMRDILAGALQEWNTRPWWVRLAGRGEVDGDRVTISRWMEHAMGFSQRMARE